MSQLNNPYAAPTSRADQSSFNLPGSQIVPVSQGLRFANLIIDMIVQTVINFCVGLVLGVILIVLTGPDAGGSVGSVLSFIVGLLVSAAYYITMESILGQTIGKFVTGTKVVDASGQKPTFGTIVIRTLVRNIPFEPFSFLVSPTSGWHDTLSKTFVVKSR